MIGSVLKEARTLKNLSQPDIAKLVGVTKQTYLKWENDVTEPKATQVNKLAEVLGISANEICAGKLDKKMSLNSFIINMSKVDIKVKNLYNTSKPVVRIIRVYVTG